MKSRNLAVIAAAALILPGVALAQTTAPKKDPRIDLIFNELDANKDGKVTKEEREAFRGNLFTSADSNKDGALDSAELAAHMRARSKQMIEKRFAAFDANRDGRLTLDEFPGRAKQRMWRTDANTDGAVTKAEMATAAERRMRIRLSRGMMRLDVDRDGKLSRNEFVDGGFRLFRIADRNRDGAVTREELAATFARWDERRGRRWGGHHLRGRRWGGHHEHRGWREERRPGRGMRDKRDRRGMGPRMGPGRMDRPGGRRRDL